MYKGEQQGQAHEKELLFDEPHHQMTSEAPKLSQLQQLPSFMRSLVALQAMMSNALGMRGKRGCYQLDHCDAVDDMAAALGRYPFQPMPCMLNWTLPPSCSVQICSTQEGHQAAVLF